MSNSSSPITVSSNSSPSNFIPSHKFHENTSGVLLKHTVGTPKTFSTCQKVAIVVLSIIAAAAIAATVIALLTATGNMAPLTVLFTGTNAYITAIVATAVACLSIGGALALRAHAKHTAALTNAANSLFNQAAETSTYTQDAFNWSAESNLLKVEKDDLTTKLYQQQTDLNSLNTKINDLNNEILSLNASISKNLEENNNVTPASLNELTLARDTIKSLEAQIAEIQKNITDLTKQNKILQKDIDDSEENKLSMNFELNSEQFENRRLDSDLLEAREQIAELRKALNEVKSLTHPLEVAIEVAILESQAAGLENLVQEKQGLEKTLESQGKTLNTVLQENCHLHVLTQAQTKEIHQISSELQDQIASNEKLREEIEDDTRLITNLENENQALINDLDEEFKLNKTLQKILSPEKSKPARRKSV